jgi:esterase/lipase
VKFAVFEDSSHLITDDEPERLFAAIEGFIANL